jgi:hypothetical protein
MEVVTIELVVAPLTVALDIGLASLDRAHVHWPRSVLMEEHCRGHHQLGIMSASSSDDDSMMFL